jgi:hypothetical protein
VQAGIRRALERLQAPQSEQEAAIRKQRAKLHQVLDKLARRRMRATEQYADGDVGKTEYEALIAKNRSEVAAVERDLAGLADDARTQPLLPPVDAVLAMAGNWVAVLGGADVQAQRDALDTLLIRVEPVRVSHAGRRTEYAVRITWTPFGQFLVDAAEGASS